MGIWLMNTTFELPKIHYSIKSLQQLVIMRNRQQGGAMILHTLEQQVQDKTLVVRIKIAGGFIRQDHFWLGQERPADGDTLLFAVGEVIGISLQLVSYSHILSEGRSPGALLFIQLEGAGYAIGMENVVKDVEIIKKFEVLKYKAYVGDTEITSLSIVKSAYLDVVHTDGAFERGHYAGNQIQKCGLAGTARPDDRNLRTFGDRELVDAKTELASWVLEMQFLNMNHRITKGQIRISNIEIRNNFEIIIPQ